MTLRGLFVCLALFAFLLQVGDAVGSDVAGAPASGGGSWETVPNCRFVERRSAMFSSVFVV